MKGRYVAALCSLFLVAFAVLAYRPVATIACIVDPAGAAHWSAFRFIPSNRLDCDPWRLVKVERPISSLNVVYTSAGWGERSRQLLIERNGRIALMREDKPMLGEWVVDREIQDSVLSRELLKILGPLATYNRYNLKSLEANPDAPFLPDSPRVRCDGEATDGGLFYFEVVAIDGRHWWSSIDSGCTSMSVDYAQKRLADAFALAVKRTGAGPAKGETFYMRLK